MKENVLDRWTEGFAYGLGLFTADGCLSSDGRHLDFTSKELEQIENFKLAWNLDTKISNKSNGYSPQVRYFRVQFGDVKLYRFLESIGLMPRKSLLIKKIEVPDRLFRDFLRGYLDGDGSISFNRHPESNLFQIKIRFASGSIHFLEWLKGMVERLAKAEGGYIHVRKDASQLAYYKRDSLKIINFMYYKENVLALNRKKQRALDFLSVSQDFIPGRWQNRFTSAKTI